jgi:hypothetical protein
VLTYPSTLIPAALAAVTLAWIVVLSAVSDPLFGLRSTYFASEPSAVSPFHPNAVLKYDGIASFCVTVGSKRGVGVNDPLTAVMSVDQLVALGKFG